MKISSVANNFDKKNNHKPSFGDVIVTDGFWRITMLDKEKFPEFNEAVAKLGEKYPNVDCYAVYNEQNTDFNWSLIFSKKNTKHDFIKEMEDPFAANIIGTIQSIYERRGTVINDDYIKIDGTGGLNHAAKLPETMNEVLPEIIEKGLKIKTAQDEMSVLIKRRFPSVTKQQLDKSRDVYVNNSLKNIVSKLKQICVQERAKLGD